MYERNKMRRQKWSVRSKVTSSKDIADVEKTLVVMDCRHQVLVEASFDQLLHTIPNLTKNRKKISDTGIQQPQCQPFASLVLSPTTVAAALGSQPFNPTILKRNRRKQATREQFHHALLLHKTLQLRKGKRKKFFLRLRQ